MCSNSWILTVCYKLVTLFLMKQKRTSIKRVNLSLPQKVVYLVQILADLDDVPLTQKARELLEQGLETEEDRILVDMAEARLGEIEEGAVQPLSSEDFWKMVEQGRT